MSYSYTKKIDSGFDEAIIKTKNALLNQGFGILMEIDVRQTLKDKLDAEFENYIILGACYPALAYEALKIDKYVGLLLPCNVIVRKNIDQVEIFVALPTSIMAVTRNHKLGSVAKKIEEKLLGAIKLID